MKINSRTRSIWVIGLLVLLSACGENKPVIVEATGDITVQELELSGFEDIEVSDMFKVEIVQGQGFRVIVELEESLVPFQEIVTRGKELRIGLKSGYSYQFENAIPRVEVTLPELTRVEITGKSTVVIHEFKNLREIEITMDDCSSITGDIEADSLRVEISGHSGFHLSGTAEEVVGSVSGQSILDLSNFVSKEISVDADQHSEIRRYNSTSPIRTSPTPLVDAIEGNQTDFPTAIPINSVDFQGWSKYANDTYGFSLLLPPEWVVDESATGVPLLKGHLLNLHPQNNREGLTIRMTFRRVGDEVFLWPTGVGAGEFVPHGMLDVAGEPVRRMLFVCPNGQIDSIWYQGESGPNVQRGSLEFGFIYSYTGVYCQEGYSLGGKVQHVGEMIIASLQVP